MEMQKRKRIGLNLLYFRADQTGGGETYARGLVSALQRAGSEFDFFAFVNRDTAGAFRSLAEISPTFHIEALAVPTDRSLRHLWEQLRFWRICKKYRIDLLHSLGNVSPLALPCKKAVTVHDLLYKHIPSLSFNRRFFYSLMIPGSTKTCDGVLAVSLSTYTDLQTLLKVPPEKLFLVPEGPGQEFSASSDWQTLRHKYSLPEEYFLAVGTAQHKRLDISLAAVRSLLVRGIRTHLVVAGEDMESTQRISGNGELSWLGYVPQQELAALYKHATAVICSSEMEGFGLPILEAMSLGTPVISTDRGSLAEVVGDGGVIVKCGDADALASAMIELRQPRFRRQVIDRGLEHAAMFSWDLCARRTLAAYRAILQAPSHSAPADGC